MAVETVCVLMSTYNGEKYIEDQIYSILNQVNVNIQLIIRDDGSCDDTLNIIGSIKDSRIHIIRGENLGWKKSFSYLLRNAPSYDYYAFSDQDDIWDIYKLDEAIKRLKKIKEACVYYCDAEIVDGNLNKMGIKKNMNPFPKKITNIFICSGQGCCMVLNNSAKKLFSEYEPISDFSHEAWICILCGYFGRIIHDESKLIKYRITGKNTSGYGKISQINLIKSFFDLNFREKVYPPYAKELIKGYSGRLEMKDQKELNYIINYKSSLISKLFLLTNSAVHRQTKMGTIGLKIAILFNLY